MTGEKRLVDLLIFYLVSFVALVVLGLIYKILFVVYNYAQFSSLAISEISYALIWGVRFDIASAGLLSLLGCLLFWVFYRLLPSKNPATVLLVVMLALQFSMQIGDIVYYAEAGRHVSYEMRDALADASGLFMTAVTKHAMFFVLSYLLGFIVIFLVTKVTARFFQSHPQDATSGTGFKFKYEIKLLLILLVSVISVRGGVTGVPQSVISAFKIGDAQQAIIAMNGAYSVVYGVLHSSKEVSRVSVKLPDTIDMNKVMRSLYASLPGADNNDRLVKKNTTWCLFSWKGGRLIRCQPTVIKKTLHHFLIH